MPSTSTGGPDPSAGKGWDPAGSGGVLSWPLVGASDGPGSSDPGEATFGADRSGNNSMRDMGSGTSFSTVNADASGKQSMQDMSGAKNSVSPKPMNTAGDHFSVDRTGNPMSSLEGTETYC